MNYSKSLPNFTTQCVVSIRATSKGPDMVERGLAIGTALAPVIGYDEAARLVKEAAKSGKTIREIAREQTKLSEAELEQILNPAKMTEPGLEGGPHGTQGFGVVLQVGAHRGG